MNYRSFRELAHTTDFHRHGTGEIHAHHSGQILNNQGYYNAEGEEISYYFQYDTELLPSGSTSSYYSSDKAVKFIRYACENLKPLI